MTNLEAYLFLKKSHATLERSITVEDIEKYLRFEAKYSQEKPSTNILNMVSLLFARKSPGKIDLREFR